MRIGLAEKYREMNPNSIVRVYIVSDSITLVASRLTRHATSHSNYYFNQAPILKEFTS